MIRKLFKPVYLNRCFFADQKKPPTNLNILKNLNKDKKVKQDQKQQEQNIHQVKQNAENKQDIKPVQQQEPIKQNVKVQSTEQQKIQKPQSQKTAPKSPILQTEKEQMTTQQKKEEKQSPILQAKNSQEPQDPKQEEPTVPIEKNQKNLQQYEEKKRILEHHFMELEELTHMEYKSYPTHLSHNDPDSKDYVHSERDEFRQNTEIDAYNSVIRQLKNDLHMQRQVYDVLEKMDRPYLQGVPGNTKNLSIGLQDYGVPEDIGYNQNSDEFENNYIEENLRNQDRWISNSQFFPKYDKMSHEIEHEKELDARPVRSDFHVDKGSKYDFATPDEDKYPFLADRLGHPEILGTPFERLMRLESDIYHPVNLDQPFVQIPRAEPNDDLIFDEGEVIYENSQLQEWAKFVKMTGMSIYGFFAFFVPYNLIMKTHFPLQDAYNNVFLPYHSQSYFNYDNLNLHIPAFAGSAMYLTYYFFASSDRMFRDYVVKLQYSKDKELLFVTRVSPYGATEEQVYEMAHLEVLPPSVKTAVPFLSSQYEDGLWDVTCMNTQQSLVLKNEDHFWAQGHKKDFLNKVTGLWQDYAQDPEYDQQIGLTTDFEDRIEPEQK